ncbi:MAG: L-histidine N(alpha)-methyltransferase [Catalinimonas sp.]
MSETITEKTTFEADVRRGLTTHPKSISSRYFYDAAGDRLFQRIMAAPEYYPTDCELEIFQTHAGAFLELFGGTARPFDLVEFGAGDGTKTKVLLEHFLRAGARFRYQPIDISANAVRGLTDDLRRQFPDLRVEGICDEYFAGLRTIGARTDARKVMLFLGSNIGNFSAGEAHDFLTQMRRSAAPGDLLMIGMDLKKDPAVVLAAYNDAAGVTRDFNLNLLARINRELGGHFDLDAFMHWPTYNPATGEARSYLVSKRAQRVRIDKLALEVDFDAWEPIYTEKSQKYAPREAEAMAEAAGFRVRRHFFDRRRYFVDSVWEVVT